MSKSDLNRYNKEMFNVYITMHRRDMIINKRYYYEGCVMLHGKVTVICGVCLLLNDESGMNDC